MQHERVTGCKCDRTGIDIILLLLSDQSEGGTVIFVEKSDSLDFFGPLQGPSRSQKISEMNVSELENVPSVILIIL